MTIGLTLIASIIVGWYILRGAIEGRMRIILLCLAAGSLAFIGSWAVRAWTLTQSGVDIFAKVAGAVERTGIITGGTPWW